MSNRPSVEFNGLTLYMDMIYSIEPLHRSVTLRAHEYYYPLIKKPGDHCHGLIFFKVDNDILFNRIKFEYIKFIKTLPKPEDRVADFEYRDENNLPDFDKMDRLIEMRKTRDERAAELKDEIEIKQQCEKFNIEYFGPLRDK